jgi:thiamine pyrophosphate-dependent acetolactate synthase large subunit-like protein
MSETQKQEIVLGMRELQPNASTFIAQALKELGVEIAFGVHGGHIWQMVDEISNAGIKIVTVRHEQAAVYAAESYSKVTKRLGVCYATAGPGVANCVSAMQQAWLSRSPVLMLAGGNEHQHDDTYTIQPSNAKELFGHITKWNARAVTSDQIKQFIMRAAKDAMAYPKGPVCIEFDMAMLFMPVPPQVPAGIFGVHSDYVESWRGDQTGHPLPQPGGDPRLIEEIVERIYRSEKPLMLAGDGVHWSDAQNELREFVELTQIPTSVRRIARGALDEASPLYWSSRIGRQVLKENDLTVLMGMKIGYFDGYGAAWRNAIQINESPEQIAPFFKTDLCLIGSPKVVMRQMIDHIRAKRLKPPSARSAWVKRLAELNQSNLETIKERAESYRSHKPIHFAYLSKAIWDVCENLYGGMNRVVMDGFTFSSWFPPFMHCRYSGQYQDASEQAGVGHGIGMGIGTAFADLQTKKYPVIVLMGDSGMGNGAMDIELALRFKLPIVYIVSNNNGWLTGMKPTFYGKDWGVLGPQDREQGAENLPDIRYDKMFEAIGCHGEFVTDPSEIKLAVERACRAAEKGRTAVVNVLMDHTITNREVYSPLYTMAWQHIPWDKLPKRGKALRRRFLPYPWDKLGIPEMPIPDPWMPISEEEQKP